MEPPTTPVSMFSRGWAAVTGRKKKGKKHGLQIRKATRRPTALGVDLIEDLPSSPTHFQIANNLRAANGVSTYNNNYNPSEEYTAQVMQISPRRLPANPLAPTVHAPPNIEGRRKESSVSAHEYASVYDPRSSLMEQHTPHPHDGEYSEVADQITTAHAREFENDAYPSIDADPDPLARGSGDYSRLQKSNLPFLSQTEREWNGMAPAAAEGESPYSTLSPRALHGMIAPPRLHVLTVETVVVGGFNSSTITNEFESSGQGIHAHGHGHDASVATAASTNQHIEQVLTQPVGSGGYEVAVPIHLQAKAHVHAAVDAALNGYANAPGNNEPLYRPVYEPHNLQRGVCVGGGLGGGEQTTYTSSTIVSKSVSGDHNGGGGGAYEVPVLLTETTTAGSRMPVAPAHAKLNSGVRFSRNTRATSGRYGFGSSMHDNTNTNSTTSAVDGGDGGDGGGGDGGGGGGRSESGSNAAQQLRWSIESDEGPNVHASGSSGVGAGGYSKLGARTKGSLKSGGGGGGGAKYKRDGKTDRSHYSRLDRLAPPPMRGIARLSTAGAHVDNRGSGSTSVGASASTSAIGKTAQKTPQHVQLRLGNDLGVIRSSVYSMYGFEGNIMASNGQAATAAAAAVTETPSIPANNTGNGTAAAAAAGSSKSTPPLSSTKQNNVYEEPADALIRCSVYSLDGNSGGGGDDNGGEGYLAIGDGTSGGSGSNNNGVGGGFSTMRNERQYAHADLTDDSDAESSGGSSHGGGGDSGGGGGGSQWGFGDSIAEPVAIASISAANNDTAVNDGDGSSNNSNTTDSNHGNHLTNGTAAAAAAAATSSRRDQNDATLTSTLSFQPVEFTVTPASPTSPTADGRTLRVQSVRRQNPLFAHQQKLAKENRRKVMANEEEMGLLSTHASPPSPSSPSSSTNTCSSVPQQQQQQQQQQTMTRNLSYLNALTADGGGSSSSSSSSSGVARDGSRYVRPNSERPKSSDSTGFC